ncbi:MAG: HAD hydrolase-like protein [Treponema sp.]|jgi:phosphoglycolate phosphatase|nr:HAD hydrolase-like protein [Treponema sp.]
MAFRKVTFYNTVLFDLDGTVTDSYLGITNSAKYALSRFGIIEENNTLKSFIGPPLEWSFKEYYSFSEYDVKRAVEYYRTYYSEKGVYENELYKGIDIVLKNLHEANINCIIATSKLEKYAIKVLQYFNIERYFRYVVGSNWEGTLSDKGDIIAYTIDKFKLAKEHTIMVGDRKYDIIGAKSNGIDSIGVLYGYGTKEELDKAGATYICNRVDDLFTFFQNMLNILV